jgi:hypothetical protein
MRGERRTARDYSPADHCSATTGERRPETDRRRRRRDNGVWEIPFVVDDGLCRSATKELRQILWLPIYTACRL